MKLISSKLTCKMMVCTLCSIMMAFLFMGCERDVYNPNNGKDDEKTPNSFDFSTTSSIQVNVKYDVPEGYKVNAERKSKVDDNTAKMQSIKWLGV